MYSLIPPDYAASGGEYNPERFKLRLPVYLLFDSIIFVASIYALRHFSDKTKSLIETMSNNEMIAGILLATAQAIVYCFAKKEDKERLKDIFRRD